jgi:7-cyano-7-deazaguanine synthase
MRALLFSGGIDSTALAAWQRPDVLVTIDYGQCVAGAEVRAATEIARRLRLRHELIQVNAAALGVGHLAGRPPSELGAAPEWWPYRNQLLVTLAAMRLVPEGLSEISIGTVMGDDIYADGRPEFVAALDQLMALQEGAIRVSAPALSMTSEHLLERAPNMSELIPWTFSWLVTDFPCGQCRGCTKHRLVLEAMV